MATLVRSLLGVLSLVVLPMAAFAGGATAADPPRAEPAAEPPPATAPDCAIEVAASVQSHYDGIRDLSARFEQQTLSAAFPDPQSASGSVEFAKPGKMRWSYEAPQPSLVVSDGASLWIVDPEAREVQLLPVDQGFLSGTAIHFLLGEGRLLEAFDVAASGCDDQRVTLRLEPKEPATYEYLELEVRRSSGEVLGTLISDLLGNRTTVAFSDLERNQDLPAERFRYEPGPDERVMRLAP